MYSHNIAEKNKEQSLYFLGEKDRLDTYMVELMKTKSILNYSQPGCFRCGITCQVSVAFPLHNLISHSLHHVLMIKGCEIVTQ